MKRKDIDSAEAFEREIDRENARIEREAATIEREMERGREPLRRELWSKESPTIAQLKYIRSLGGDIRTVSNKYEAHRLIQKLVDPASQQGRARRVNRRSPGTRTMLWPFIVVMLVGVVRCVSN